MTSDYVERVRENRSSGAVLKARLSNIRSRHQKIAIFVFEGTDDVGPYGAWISRIDDDLRYEPLPAMGKDQVLNLRTRLLADKGGLGRNVFLFVDRDFDDLREHASGSDIFCTDAYSVENYLVSREVLSKILTDELRCIADSEDRERALALFESVSKQFQNAMMAANARLFCGARLGIRGKGLSDRISSYVEISLKEVAAIYSAESLSELVPLEREPSDDEYAAARKEFCALPPHRHRGKFLLSFFFRWIDLIAAERRNAEIGLFSEPVGTKFSSQKLSLGWLASRSSMPDGLREFISGIDLPAFSGPSDP